MKKSTKLAAAGTLGAAFATVAVVGLVPALNGSQPAAVWQQEAERSVQATQEVSPYSAVTFSSSKEANSAGFYDSKILDFEVKTTVPGLENVIGYETKTAEVRCDQEKSELGLRGGQITCSAPVFKNAQWTLPRWITG
jgi:hypothetical protein